MNMNRRGFFKLIAGAAVVAATPIEALTSSDAPTIYCNGVDCDAAGLNALLRGEVVRFETPEMANHIYWRGDVLHLNGKFQVHMPLQISGMDGKTLDGGEFEVHSRVCFRVMDSSNMVFQNMRMQGYGEDQTAIYFNS